MLEDLGVTVEDGMISGKDLYKVYTDLYIKEQEIYKQELYSSLGLGEDGVWTDSPESLESIQRMLDQRLTNQQDKEIIEIVYVVESTDPNTGEKTVSKYTKEELEESGLEATRAEFNLPIWLSPNSHKFESVLNSIVSNKMVHLKEAISEMPST